MLESHSIFAASYVHKSIVVAWSTVLCIAYKYIIKYAYVYLVFICLKRMLYSFLFCEFTGFSDGRVQLNNPHLRQLGVDALYHFALDTENNDLLAMFGDVKVNSKSCSFMYFDIIYACALCIF